jgi:glycosyltransferase involved in cell wall biosynthesis
MTSVHGVSSTVAYLANEFPSPVERYVTDEIRELGGRGVRVVPCSIRRPSDRKSPRREEFWTSRTLYLLPLDFRTIGQAWLRLIRESPALGHLPRCILLQGGEDPFRRLRALIHTWLGACLAVRLQPYRPQHIHVHHGYFGAWVGMVAARLLNIGFSMTLHGSDILIHHAYLQTKLEECRFCFTISEFNLRYLEERYPSIPAQKILLNRLGVDPPAVPAARVHGNDQFRILSVGRLHAIKDHAFLVRACANLKASGLRFSCGIAGEGPERRSLQQLILELGLEREVRLLGHVLAEDLQPLYSTADLVALTSRSEGIPVVLMEAMAHGALVLAPDITGIPELVIDGQTGFLYPAGSIADFCKRVLEIFERGVQLDQIRTNARRHICRNFDRRRNLSRFCDLFLARISPPRELSAHENPVLQQI